LLRLEDSELFRDRELYVSDVVVLGEFRCTVQYPFFATAGAITQHVIVFPRNAVWIEREDSRRFVADPTLATLYNPRQQYQRFALSPNGDRSDWVRVPEMTLREIAAQVAPKVSEASVMFRVASAPVSNSTFVAQRRLFNAARAAAPDRLRVEELALRVIEEMVRSVLADAVDSPRVSNRALELAEEAKAQILASPFDNLGVADIAARTGVSPFHLCRTFRAATGTTLHAYRRAVRLRSASELTAVRRGRLSSLAIDLGFHSHSHFTAAFRREFGMAPSMMWDSVEQYRPSTDVRRFPSARR
jgi:AraC family transcriptional regulator